MSKGPIKYSDFFNDDVQAGLQSLNQLFSDVKTSAASLKGVFISELKKASKQIVTLEKDLNDLRTKLNSVDIANKGAATSISEYAKQSEKLIAKHKEAKATYNDLNLLIDVHTMGLKECRDTIKSLEKEYSELSKSGKENTVRQQELLTKIKEVSVQFNKLNSDLKNAKKGVDLVKGSYAFLSNETVELRKKLQSIPGAFDSVTGAINKTNKEAVELQSRIKQNTDALKKMDAQMGMHFRNVGNYSSALSKLGGGIVGFSAQALGVLSAADAVYKTLQANIQLEAQMADLRRIMGLTKDETYELVDALKELSTPTSTVELVRIATIGSQLGISRKEIVGFTKSVDMLSVVLKNEIPGGAEVVAESLGKINGVFDITNKEGVSTGIALEKTGSAILALGQAGLATGGFLQDFTLRVGGSAKAADIGLPTILAYGAVLEEAGITAEVAGTAFNRLVGSLTSKREKFFAIAKIADSTLTIEKFTKIINKDANEALTLFYKGLNKGGTSLTAFNDLLDQIGIKAGPGKNAIIALAREQEKLTQRIDEGTQAFNEGTLAGEQFGGMTDNLSSSWDKMIKAFTDTSTKKSVASFFQVLIDGVTATVNAFNKLVGSSSWKEFFIRTTGSIGALSGNYQFSQMMSSMADVQAIVDKENERQRKFRANPAKARLDEFGSASVDEQNKLFKAQKEAFDIQYKDFKLKKAANDLRKKDIENMQYQVALMDGMNKIMNSRKKVSSSGDGGDSSIVDEAANKKALKAAEKAKQDALKLIDEGEKLKLLLLQNAYNSQDELQKNFEGKQIDSEEKYQSQKLEIQKQAIENRLKLENIGSPQYQKLIEDRKTLELEFNKWKKEYDEKQLQNKYEIELANLDQIYAAGEILETEYQKKRTDVLVAELERRLALETDAVKKAQLEAQIAQTKKEGSEKYISVNGTPTLKTDAEKDLPAKSSTIQRKFELDQSLLNTRELKGEDVTTERLLNEAKMLQELRTLYKSYGKDVSDIDQQIVQNITTSNEHTTQKQIENIEKIKGVMMKSVDIISDYLGEGWGNLFGTLTDQLFDFVKKGKIQFKDLGEAVAFYGLMAQSVGQIVFQSQIDQSQKRVEMLESEKERVVEIETAGIEDEKERARIKEQIEADYNAKIRAEKKKQAVAERNNALFQIAINTAMGITMALAQLGPIAGIIMAAVVGGIGIAQAAMVMSKPLAYWTGTRNSEEGIADVAERGHEIVKDSRTGKMTYYKDRTQIYIPKGSQVFNARETDKMLERMKIDRYSAANREMASSVHEYKRNSEVSIMAEAFKSMKIDEAKLADAIGARMSGLPLTNWTVDENGFRKRIRKGNTTVEMLNKRNSLK